MQQCIKIFIITYLYEAQHVSGDTPPIIRSLKVHWQPLVFHTWKVVGHAHCAWQRPSTTRPTTFHVWKTRGCQCTFRLLMMGGVSPETCWASYKYGIIKILIHCCILLDISLRIVLWCTDPRTTRMFIWGCGLDESAMPMTDSLYRLQWWSPPNKFWCVKQQVFYVTCCLLVILNKQNSEKVIKSKGDIVISRKPSVIITL